MSGRIVKALVVCVGMAGLAGCIDHANAPLLLPVGTPVNPPDIAHGICTTDGNAMYDEAKKQYQVRAAMTGYGKADPYEAEMTARSAARRQYVTCASSQGYRTVYTQ